MTLHTVPMPEPPNPSRFYEALARVRRTEDALRLIREAEQIAADYADRRWGKAVPS